MHTEPVLQVEPTDLCNLSCSMCAPHHEGWAQIHGVPKGMLELGRWQRIAEGLAADDCRFDHVIFQWLGDPSLHPELHRILGVAARTLGPRVGYLRVDTNAITLTPSRLDAILDAVEGGPAPLLLVFTLDAHQPETYTRVKGQDALERVRRHVRHLIRARRQRGGRCRVNLQLQFVVQPGNAGEAGAFLRYWADLLDCQGGADWHDEVLFKRLSVGGGASGQAAADALYERTVVEQGLVSGRVGGAHVKLWESRPWQQDDGHSGARGPCPGLWVTPVIRHDGHLMMCCADLGGELDLGSLEGSSFRALWEGELATSRRLAHLQGRFEGVCARCGGINWYTLREDQVRQTRARAQELGLSASA